MRKTLKTLFRRLSVSIISMITMLLSVSVVPVYADGIITDGSVQEESILSKIASITSGISFVLIAAVVIAIIVFYFWWRNNQK